MVTDTAVPRPRSSLPGPQGLPLLGAKMHLLQLYLHPFVRLRELYTTYGDIVVLTRNNPMLVFAFGPQHNFSLLSNPDLFYASSEKSFEKVPRGTAFTHILRNNLQHLDGEPHQRQRHLMMPAFHERQIVNYHRDIVEQTQSLLDSWGIGRELDLAREMQRLTQNVVDKTLFGLADDEKVARLRAQIHKLTKVMALGAGLPIDFPGLPYRQALQLAQKFATEMRELIEQKRGQAEATDMLTVLSQSHDEVGEKLTDDQVIGQVFAFYTTAYQTIANALTWTNFLLMQHPHILANLLAELDEKLHGAPPTSAQLSQLPLLEGVIKEGLRLFPPAIIGKRIAMSTCELGGYELAAGTTIVYSEFLTHRLPELYTEPNRFRPERWLTLEPSPYEYLPFSAGQHRCIAAPFAMQELKIVLAIMLQRYRLALRPNLKLSVDFTMRAKPGMPVRIFAQDRQFKRTPVRGPILDMLEGI
ncbi:cytochrome P450 [Ktedonosporobacter rubrisoli]|uniref:Cytochrome P450 n=2 Tax=Ktedonosporobacter rubrisoli TaxID=2509675 RepID=A0A4V0Z0J0_KTERU|nr:cytochrome P450 [Ktedonosporobacter rubrisoli]